MTIIYGRWDVISFHKNLAKGSLPKKERIFKDIVLNFGATFFGVKNAILWLDDLKCFHLSTFSYLYSYKTGLKHQCSIKNDKYPSKMQI